MNEKPKDLTPKKKRKQSAAEELTSCKKRRNDTRNTISLNQVISLGIPHVSELVFESIDTPELFQCALVSKTWKVLAENVLIKRWKGKMFEACKTGKTRIVKLLFERCNSEESGLNTAFIRAWQEGHTRIVKLLLHHLNSNIELNAKDIVGRTALMLACGNGHTAIVKLLLDHR